MSDEPQIKNSLFDTENEDRVRSPEKIDDYIRVTTPGTWIVVLALVLILVAIIVWGVVGRIPVYYTTKGVGMSIDFNREKADLGNADDYIVKGVLCFVESNEISSRELQDKPVNVQFRDGTWHPGQAYLIDTTPEGDEEIREMLEGYNIDSDWVLSMLGQGVYRYPVYIRLDFELDYLYWGEIADASIIIDEVQPIHFLIGDRS